MGEGCGAARVIVLAGPPCSGKGTQSKLLQEKFGSIHISTGDEFRDHLRRNTEFGRQIQPYIEQGCFVPDAMVIDYIRSRLTEPAIVRSGCVLDGFPRTADQATALQAQVSVSRVLVLKAPDKALLARARGRRIDPETGDIYHLELVPPSDQILPRLIKRKLDDAQSFRVRLDTHREAQARLLPCFEKAKITCVNAMQDPDELSNELVRILEADDLVYATRKARPQSGAPSTPAPTCSICMQNEANFVVVPCGHQCGCETCLQTMLRMGRGASAHCPICRQAFTSVQRVFRCGNDSDTTTAPTIPALPATEPHADINDVLDAHSAAVSDEWPAEDSWDESAAGGEDEIQIRVCQAGAADESSQQQAVVVRIEPPAPEGDSRAPTDVCCVVDVSGSMNTAATFEDEAGNKMSDGLSVLDLVKHALRTVCHTLDGADRLSVVSFSDSATTVLPLTKMDEGGKLAAEAAIESLRAGGRTNIWAGLLDGLESLREDGAVAQRSKALLLLTDGSPNIVPPRGHVAELRDYKDQYDMAFQLNTFGFGYSLDSQLLLDLATEAGGSFAFIPDAVIVGTTFVNCVANVLSTFSQNVTLSLTPGRDCTLHSAVGEEGACTHESWGLRLSLGPLQLGMPRDVTVLMTLPSTTPSRALDFDSSTGGDMPYLHVAVQYARVGNEDGCAKGVGTTGGSCFPNAIAARLRAETVGVGCHAITTAETGGGQQAQQELQLLATRMASLLDGDDDSRLRALHNDVSGRMHKALQGKARFNRWGKHYLRALVRAHQLMLTTNFMDPGLQPYGGAVFAKLRAKGDQVFLGLPAPKPAPKMTSAGHRSQVTGGTSAPRKAPAMTTYYAGAGGGCFGPSSTVLVLRPGQGGQPPVQQRVRCADIRRGDIVSVAGGVGWASVQCVAQMDRSPEQPPLVVLQGGLCITSRHPVRMNRVWSPAASVQIAPAKTVVVDCVYNFLLDRTHILLVDGVECATWGHNLNEPGVQHAFFGNKQLVARALSGLVGWKEGYVRVAGCVRARVSGEIVGLRGAEDGRWSVGEQMAVDIEPAARAIVAVA